MAPFKLELCHDVSHDADTIMILYSVRKQKEKLYGYEDLVEESHVKPELSALNPITNLSLHSNQE